MLSQIVRPLVRTQIRLLANSQATRATLIETIAQWLGYLGVRVQVTHLAHSSGQIQVSLNVGKPESCDPIDWQTILNNLSQNQVNPHPSSVAYAEMTSSQQSKLCRLLAYVIQVGDPNQKVNWDALYPQLKALNLEESILIGIKSALKVPQFLDQVMKGIDPDVAAIALPQAVSIALLDRRVNSDEDIALTSLLDAMKESTKLS